MEDTWTSYNDIGKIYEGKVFSKKDYLITENQYIMKIENNEINALEKLWLKAILSQGFDHKDELVNQINHSKIEREYTDFYLLLKFKVDSEMPPIETDIRVPVEMHLHQPNQVPAQFLLHVVQGYVSELEIFYADSSKITEHINLKNAKIEVLVNCNSEN